MKRFNRKLTGALCAAVLGLMAGCADDGGVTDPGPGGNSAGNGGNGAAGGGDSTFDHDSVVPDAFEALARQQDEGPPEYQARVHACKKMKYSTLGRVLTSRGVNVNGAAGSAGQLYQTAAASLSAPRYDARVAEGISLTAAGAVKGFDIWQLAATEMMANLGTLTACTVNGTAPSFTGNTCNAALITCITGMPASQGLIDICNETIRNASTPEKGRQMAVAVMAASAHACE